MLATKKIFINIFIITTFLLRQTVRMARNTTDSYTAELMTGRYVCYAHGLSNT